MASMTFQTTALGLYTFAAEPFMDPPITKKRRVTPAGGWADAQIYDEGFLADAAGLLGLEINLSWEIVAAAMFDSLRGYYNATGTLADPVVWNPHAWARNVGERYQVKVSSFTWQVDHFAHDYIMQPQMTLVIRGVI